MTITMRDTEVLNLEFFWNERLVQESNNCTIRLGILRMRG